MTPLRKCPYCDERMYIIKDTPRRYWVCTNDRCPVHPEIAKTETVVVHLLSAVELLEVVTDDIETLLEMPK